jgi:hypothetical protein
MTKSRAQRMAWSLHSGTRQNSVLHWAASHGDPAPAAEARLLTGRIPRDLGRSFGARSIAGTAEGVGSVEGEARAQRRAAKERGKLERVLEGLEGAPGGVDRRDEASGMPELPPIEQRAAKVHFIGQQKEEEEREEREAGDESQGRERADGAESVSDIRGGEKESSVWDAVGRVVAGGLRGAGSSTFQQPPIITVGGPPLPPPVAVHMHPEPRDGVNSRNAAGEAPLHRAAGCRKGSSTAVMEHLLAMGADPGVRDKRGLTPCMTLLVKGEMERRATSRAPLITRAPRSFLLSLPLFLASPPSFLRLLDARGHGPPEVAD